MYVKHCITYHSDKIVERKTPNVSIYITKRMANPKRVSKYSGLSPFIFEWNNSFGALGLNEFQKVEGIF